MANQERWIIDITFDDEAKALRARATIESLLLEGTLSFWSEDNRVQKEQEITKAFIKLENSVAAYWQWDRDKSVSSRKLRALQGEANIARADLLRLIGNET